MAIGANIFVTIGLLQTVGLVVYVLYKRNIDTSVYVRNAYEPVYEFFGKSDAKVSILGTYIVLAAVFWGFNSFLVIADYFGWPKWIAKYKIQPTQNAPVDKEKLIKVFKQVAFNNLFINLCVAPVLYWQQTAAGISFLPEQCPNMRTMIRDMAVSTVIQEIMFYYSHRLFHVPLLYKHVHKRHHEWTAPMGIVCIYATATEYLLGNVLSIIMGPLMMRSHITTWWVWYTLTMMVTSIHHSGYHLPVLPSPEFHDFHHLTFNSNFGTLGVLDWFHGTDKGFRGTVQRKRHRTLWSLQPISAIFPDKPKTKLFPGMKRTIGDDVSDVTASDTGGLGNTKANTKTE